MGVQTQTHVPHTLHGRGGERGDPSRTPNAPYLILPFINPSSISEWSTTAMLLKISDFWLGVVDIASMTFPSVLDLL